MLVHGCRESDVLREAACACGGIPVTGDLTDSAGVRYYGSKERTYEYEKFGYNVFVGVRFKL